MALVAEVIKSISHRINYIFMKQVKALQTLQASGKKIFSSADLQKILQVADSNYSHVQATRLAKEGVIERVMRGWYVLASNRPSDFELANVLYGPSYVSLDSALNFYGILVQSPQEIISATTGLARKIEAGGKTFSYVHLDQKYYSDYQKSGDFLIASPEKALVDAMFFVALGRGSLSVEELNLQSIDKDKVKQMASKITNKAFKNYFDSIKI
ncbi:MAG TPA: hypothetical protein DEF59_03725 [Candidatus Magasanikbacteria bacterium]|nr:hypothetical protein [Candidatus Magasanikbacteria bacterium]